MNAQRLRSPGALSNQPKRRSFILQDILILVSLDTKVTAKPTLVPLLLSLSGAVAYKEYAGYSALIADHAEETPVAKSAKAMYDQAEITNAPLASVAVLGLADTSTPEQITAALTTLRDTHDDWYYLVPVAATDAQLTAMAAWAAATVLTEQQLEAGVKEAEKLLVAQTANAALTIASAQTVLCHNSATDTTYMHAAWVGRMAGYYPKLRTWKWTELLGITPTGLDATALDTLLGKSINTYVHNHGRNYMRDGMTADGEFIDVVIARWQIKQAIRKAVVDLLVDAGEDGIPYDDGGFGQIASVIISAITASAENNIVLKVDGKPQFTITIPRRENATEQQIANRLMPDISWSATLRGGVHGVRVNGKLSISLTA
jgi:hypothetical protein